MVDTSSVGYPFLVPGEGLAPASAAVLLSLLNVVVLVGGPLVGHLCGRLPRAASILLIIGRSAYRWAFTLQYLPWTVGAVQVLRYRSRIRRAAIRSLSLPVR